MVVVLVVVEVGFEVLWFEDDLATLEFDVVSDLMELLLSLFGILF